MARYRYFRRSLGRRYYYRNWGSKRWRNFSKYNYTNVKLDISFHVQYPSSSTGAPQIFFTSQTAANSYAFGTLLKDHSDWLTIKPLYQLYKLKGVRFECTPMSCNAGQEGITQSSAVYLGFAYSLPTELTGTSWLQYTERSLVLNPLQKTTRYWSNFGAQDDWKTINTELGGQVAVYSSETSTLNAAPIWHVRMICYVCCKLANK